MATLFGGLAQRVRGAFSADTASSGSGGRGRGFAEMGSSGLKRSGARILEGFPKDLQGARAMAFYREMGDSPIVGACYLAICKLIEQVSSTIQPASSDAEDVKRAAFVEECRGDMSFTWAQTIEEHLSMVKYGVAPHEIVYKRRGGDTNDPTQKSKYADGLIGWRKLPVRGQETIADWDLDDAGGIRGMIQTASPTYTRVTIPIEKMLLFRSSTERNNPWGRSALLNAAKPYYFAKKIQEVEGIAIERDLTGLPVFSIPAECFAADATPEQKAAYNAAVQIVTHVRRDEEEGLVIPSTRDEHGNRKYEFSLLTTGGKRQFDTGAVIERYERRIAMTLLADFILMGHEQVGSFALSSDKTALFAVALGGWLQAIAEVYNLYAIPRLMAINGWPTARTPRLVFGDVEAPNLAALGDYIAKLSGAGFNWSGEEAVDAHLRRVAGLPKKSKATILGPSGKPAREEEAA